MGTFGAILHMTYHSLAKPVSLFSAGTLAQLHSSSDLKRIGSGTFTRAPIASGLFVLAALMILTMTFLPQGLLPNVRRKLELEDQGAKTGGAGGADGAEPTGGAA